MGRRIRRYLFFVLAIAVGFAVGALIGWAIPTAGDGNAELDSLRMDYKTDTILMVSQLYQSEGDIAAALARLSSLGENIPDLMQSAINYANQHDFTLADITAMENLAGAIPQLSPTTE